MVDVSSKDNTDRLAIAKGMVRMKLETFNIMTEHHGLQKNLGLNTALPPITAKQR